MNIPYTYQGQHKTVSPAEVIRLSGAELQSAILAASFLGLTNLLPTYLILKGGGGIYDHR